MVNTVIKLKNALEKRGLFFRAVLPQILCLFLKTDYYI